MDSLALIVAGVVLYVAGGNLLEQEEQAHPFSGPGWPSLIACGALILGGIGVFFLGLVSAL